MVEDLLLGHEAHEPLLVTSSRPDEREVEIADVIGGENGGVVARDMLLTAGEDA